MRRGGAGARQVPEVLGDHGERIKALEDTQVPNVIAGSIHGGTGAVVNGSGFSCSPQSGDDYTVTFDSPLPAQPVVLAGHGGTDTVVVDPTSSVPAWGVSTTGFSVTSTDSDDWSFIAVIP